jgi:hypothetical protein
LSLDIVKMAILGQHLILLLRYVKCRKLVLVLLLANSTFLGFFFLGYEDLLLICYVFLMINSVSIYCLPPIVYFIDVLLGINLLGLIIHRGK